MHDISCVLSSLYKIFSLQPFLSKGHLSLINSNCCLKIVLSHSIVSSGLHLIGHSDDFFFQDWMQSVQKTVSHFLQSIGVSETILSIGHSNIWPNGISSIFTISSMLSFISILFMKNILVIIYFITNPTTIWLITSNISPF
jgi:hypothetical protein